MDYMPKEYFKKMKDIEKKLVSFLEKHENPNENFTLFDEYLQSQKIQENKYELKSFLYIMVAISSYYHCSQCFFTQNELILTSLKERIQFFFTNFEVFNIFQKSKLLLLILFKLRIIIPTKEIYSAICNKKYIDRKYIEYFYPEFEAFILQDQIKELRNTTLDDEFNKKRENGKNDNYLCRLIQNDAVVDFITYLETTNISPQSVILPSIYETNLFLINKNPTLIEYSAFYGSIQIFQYLYNRNAEIQPSIWPYAIHGRNAEIIQFLHDRKIKTLCGSFQYLIIESIKCHHNEISDYFRTNFCDDETIYDYYLYRKALKHYNFAFFSDDDIDSLINSCICNQQMNIPYYLAKYDYFLIVEYLANDEKIKDTFDINFQYTIYKPIKEKNEDVVQLIEIKNGDVDLCDNRYFYYNQKEILKYGKYKYDEEASTILYISIRKGNNDIVKLLLSMPKINVNIKLTKCYKEFKETFFKCDQYYVITEEMTILHEAVDCGNVEIVQYILKNKYVDVNCTVLKKKIYFDYCTSASMKYESITEKTLFHLAIEKGNIEIVQLLLSNPNVDIKMKSISKIEESGGCLSYFSSSKTKEEPSLPFAINSGNIAMIHFLLEQPKVNLNEGVIEYDSDGREISKKDALELATETQNSEIKQLLLCKL